MMAVACFGGFVTTFSVTLNNHTPAAVTALATAYVALGILVWGKDSLWRFLLAGLLAGCTAANELPALALGVIAGAGLTYINPRRAWMGYWPAFSLVVVAYLAVNYVAHGSLRPPYMHRSDGPLLTTVTTPQAGWLREGELAPPLRKLLQERLDLSPKAMLRPAELAPGWVLFDPESTMQWALRPVESAAGQDAQTWRLHAWDNWYDYPGTYWTEERRQGVDLGEASRSTYAMNVFVGHHGLLSLTPIWWLAPWGAWCWLASRRNRLRWFAAATIVMTAVCLAFYLSRGQVDRNYGGVCCMFRWALWLTPVWWLWVVPVADRLAGSWWGRAAALLLLMGSVFSAWLPGLNPWTHPWIYEYWVQLQWLP